MIYREAIPLELPAIEALYGSRAMSMLEHVTSVVGERGGRIICALSAKTDDGFVSLGPVWVPPGRGGLTRGTSGLMIVRLAETMERVLREKTAVTGYFIHVDREKYPHYRKGLDRLGILRDVGNDWYLREFA